MNLISISMSEFTNSQKGRNCCTLVLVHMSFEKVAKTLEKSLFLEFNEEKKEKC